MRHIEIITHSYETEKVWLKENADNITDCITSMKPNVRGIVQVIPESGNIREYHGLVAKKVFNYLFRLS